MFTITLSVVSTIVTNLNLKALNIKSIEGRSKNVFLYWLPWILRMNPPLNLIQRQVPGQMDLIANFGMSSQQIAKQQWIFVAVVVDRLCLIISFIFTCISFTVFFIYAL